MSCENCIHYKVCEEHGELKIIGCNNYENNPIKHARWSQVKCGDGLFDYYWKCGNCGGCTPDGGYPISPDYCGHCGALMDLE